MSLAAGADVNGKDSHGKTPLETALEEEMPVIWIENLFPDSRRHWPLMTLLLIERDAGVRGEGPVDLWELVNCYRMESVLGDAPIHVSATRRENLRQAVERIEARRKRVADCELGYWKRLERTRELKCNGDALYEAILKTYEDVTPNLTPGTGIGLMPQVQLALRHFDEARRRALSDEPSWFSVRLVEMLDAGMTEHAQRLEREHARISLLEHRLAEKLPHGWHGGGRESDLRQAGPGAPGAVELYEGTLSVRRFDEKIGLYGDPGSGAQSDPGGVRRVRPRGVWGERTTLLLADPGPVRRGDRLRLLVLLAHEHKVGTATAGCAWTPTGIPGMPRKRKSSGNSSRKDVLDVYIEWKFVRVDGIAFKGTLNDEKKVRVLKFLADNDWRLRREPDGLKVVLDEPSGQYGPRDSRVPSGADEFVRHLTGSFLTPPEVLSLRSPPRPRP